MAQVVDTTGSAESQVPILDVWSRTARRYRVRAVLMLLLLALLFAGLCCFTFWLRTGVYTPWSYGGYAELIGRSFNPTGADQITLSDFLSSPIRVQDVPVHALIMGLLFASLCSIPILVAILYRIPFSALFAAMVVFLAAMPWLGITVMIGCILTSVGPFRFTFRYASALVGLIPIAVYFVMASWEPSDAPSKLIRHQALLFAPWVLALLGSCVICAVALAIARLINYRPGGIPPVLAMLFATPALLFHSQVGRDELEYRILEREIGPGSSSYFATVNIGEAADLTARQRRSETKGSSDDDISKRFLREKQQRILFQVERDRQRAVARCDAFLEHFPTSRHVPEVLYLKGRAQNCRVDKSRLEQDQPAEFRFDLPNRASWRPWKTLIEQFPESDFGAVASFNLAVLKAREGDLDGAIASLERLVEQLTMTRSATRPARKGETVVDRAFQRSPASQGLGINLDALVQRAAQLRELLSACRNDSAKPISALFGPRADGSDVLVRPVQLLMWLDPADPLYEANLMSIIRLFPDSEAAAFAEVRLGLVGQDLTPRIRRFRDAAQALAGRPSGAMALFYLGEALQDASRLGGAKAVYEDLIAAYPQTCWDREARRRISALSILLEAEE